ncbi:hypothetical protein H8S33_05495 [Ornithinibacillus sp. BX22]|uniref:GIY-YIG domain-containing protein n=2 Tax=Ornithinibacillus TaxID=484508 RepID=A0A923L4H1_9BACI|nr:hypothetical protein [Ornithinibacillus hominis]
MNITIEFFQRDLIPAIGAGIYEISVCKNDKSKILYIGESVFVLVRCASHLYELNKDPKYFGFNEDTIRDSSVKLRFRLLEKVNERDLRKKREKELIKEKAPLTQSGISDYQKSVEDKVSALTKFLNSSCFTNL